MADVKDPLERFRLTLLSRGANGIRGMGKSFRVIDDNKSNSLNCEEFCKAVTNYGVKMTKEEMKSVFTRFDKDGSDSIDFEEFLTALTPPNMNDARKAVVSEAFSKTDRTGDGCITAEDLKNVYKGTDEAIKLFLDGFDSAKNKDGKITKDEFMAYYSGLSLSMENDEHFILMVRNAFKI